jgi:uncharacterized protein YjlB
MPDSTVQNGPDAPEVLQQRLVDDGTYPNNGELPLLLYRGALELAGDDAAAGIEALFQSHHWGHSWRNGVYGFHHYHSTAHEALGVYSGTAQVQLGGEKGLIATLSSGDMVVIPAGVAHKNLGASPDFRCVGAYPQGQRPDMNYGRPDERPAADQRIAAVPLPQADPAFGTEGPLVHVWLKSSP